MDIQVIRTKEINPNVKPFLVDVPVKTNVWTRPNCQRRQFEVIKKARPSILFIQSDGGRNEQEWELIRQNRRIFDEEIDWDCTIYKIFSDRNLGLYSMYFECEKYIWNQVDRCIFLEDDHIPAISYFRFCAEMLEKYKDDLRICAICGMNHLTEYERPTTDYFFARVGSIWGVAFWKRTAESFGITYQNDPYVINEVCNIAKKDTFYCKSMRGYAKGEKVGGHIPGPEFFLVQDIFAQNQLFLLPKKNMISCIGAESGSTHAVDSIKKMAKGDAQFFEMKTFELDGEIKHPDYVFPDLTYEKRMKRVTAWHHPGISTYRRWVGYIKRVYYGDGLIMRKKIPVRIRRMLGKEHEK